MGERLRIGGASPLPLGKNVATWPSLVIAAGMEDAKDQDAFAFDPVKDLVRKTQRQPSAEATIVFRGDLRRALQTGDHLFHLADELFAQGPAAAFRTTCEFPRDHSTPAAG